MAAWKTDTGWVPDQVMNGVITPVNGLEGMGNSIYYSTCRGYNPIQKLVGVHLTQLPVFCWRKEG